jgi:diguanylate cyclase (GGDEF)-like protein
VLFSDDPGLIGERMASHGLDHAMQGHMELEVSEMSDEEDRRLRSHGKLLEVYVPLRYGRDQPIVGAWEIYLPYRPIERAMRDDVRVMGAVLLAGLTLLYLALIPIVVRISRALRRHASENEHLAMHDPLTGLPNRTLFMDRVAHAIAGAGRDARTVAVLLLDLDRFKDVNDALGHGAGDVLLAELAGRLGGVVRAGDTVARLGGDEFAIVVPDAGDREAVGRLAERLETALAVPVVVDGLPIEVEASVGAALHPEHGDDAETLLRRADIAMYVAKRSRCRHALYTDGSDRDSAERVGLIADLRGAMEAGQLVCHYQPKADLATGEVRGVEALLRWQHPRRGLVPPGEFIPAAEHTGLIGPLTMHVLDVALADARRWRDAGTPLTVAVNLAAPNLADRGLPAQVARALDRHGLPGDALELEITETAMLSDPERAEQVLAELAAMRVTVALDDFGTGYSSLARLGRLPLHALKVDRTFVARMHDGGGHAAIVRSTVDLGHNLGLQVVAEGVERPEDWDALRALGCDVAQGYGIARPMPASAMLAWAARWRAAAPERRRPVRTA